MAYRNNLNIADESLDKPIYRIMPIHRVLECFQKKQLVLVPPKKWDDPFENLLLSSKIISTNSESSGSFAFRDKVYGQCWTWHEETDAMWRIYSSDKNGARIKSTPRKLLAALKNSDVANHALTCFIGEVNYMNQKSLVEKLTKLDILDTNGSGIAESLIYKREEFKHEKEVRLIYTGDAGDVYPFTIHPNEDFDEVVFDPRMDQELFEAYKAALVAKNYHNRIAQSVLYRPPRQLLIDLESRF